MKQTVIVQVALDISSAMSQKCVFPLKTCVIMYMIVYLGTMSISATLRYHSALKTVLVSSIASIVKTLTSTFPLPSGRNQYGPSVLMPVFGFYLPRKIEDGCSYHIEFQSLIKLISHMVMKSELDKREDGYDEQSV